MPELVLIESGSIQAGHGLDRADTLPVDILVKEVSADKYDVLVLSGGVANPDRLRVDQDAVEFVIASFERQKPVGAIRHGTWMLVESGPLKGRIVTSWPSLRTAVRNAGGGWIDAEVQVDNGLVPSRKYADLPAFGANVVEEIAEGPQVMAAPPAKRSMGRRWACRKNHTAAVSSMLPEQTGEFSAKTLPREPRPWYAKRGRGK